MAGIEPRTPAQQASALSFTTLPLDRFGTISEAVAAIKETENLGFVMESSYADFVTAQNCDLTSFGHLGERQYAIALPKHSVYKDQIDQQLLSYLHDGTIEALRQKWIQKSSKCRVDQGSSSLADSSYNPTVFGICKLLSSFTTTRSSSQYKIRPLVCYSFSA